MMEQLIALKDKILEFWNKYTSKQKTIIICVACAILVAIVLLAYFMTRPVYTDVATLSGETATTFDTALQGAGLDYVKESDNNGNTTFKVEQSQYSDAVLLMGENQITDDEMTWEKALQSAERLATERLWVVAGPTQVRPMTFFEDPNLREFLLEPDTLRRIREAAFIDNGNLVRK